MYNNEYLLIDLQDDFDSFEPVAGLHVLPLLDHIREIANKANSFTVTANIKSFISHVHHFERTLVCVALAYTARINSAVSFAETTPSSSSCRYFIERPHCRCQVTFKKEEIACQCTTDEGFGNSCNNLFQKHILVGQEIAWHDSCSPITSSP